MVMWIYAIVLSIVGLFALCSLSLPKANLLRRVLLIATLLVLVLFMGFRDRVGADWDTYQAIFDAYSGTGLKNPFTTVPIEPGYAVLNYISASLSTGIYLVNFVCAAIMIGALARFAYLVDVDAILVLFLALPYLVFIVGMGYTRQATAIGLACTALGYWVREERTKFCLTAILATTFHYSAVFLLLLVWIKNWRRVVLAIPLAFIGGYLFLTMVYMHYFAFYVQNTVDLHSSGVWFRLAIVLLGVILTIAQRRRWREEPRLFGLLKGGSP